MKVPPQTTKLYLAGVFLLTLALLVFVQAAFNLSPFFSPSEPNQIVLLVTLSTFIFLVLLVFGFVLLRTLVKVWAERRVGKWPVRQRKKPRTPRTTMSASWL